MRSIVIIILVTGILATAPSYAADKVYSDSDLKNYSSPRDEDAYKYNQNIIQKNRADRAYEESKRDLAATRAQQQKDWQETQKKQKEKQEQAARDAANKPKSMVIIPPGGPLIILPGN